MICLICREAQTVSGHTSIHFERDEFKALIRQIPAQVCPACGESYLDEGTASILLKRIEQMLADGEMDIVLEFE